MMDEELIHVRLEYLESLEARKSILNVEKNLISIKNTSRLFNSLRIKELKTKCGLYAKLRETSVFLKNLKKTLPQLKISKPLKEEKFKAPKVREIPKMKESSDIEIQLREIQEKLNSLQK